MPNSLREQVEAQRRDQCPQDRSHGTVRKHGVLHCNDCGRPLYE
jgi:hypothetical protein